MDIKGRKKNAKHDSHMKSMQEELDLWEVLRKVSKKTSID